MAQIKPVTVRAAKTNIVIGALPRSALAAPADRRKLPGLEAPRSEALHTTAIVIIRCARERTAQPSSQHSIFGADGVSRLPISTAPRDAALIRLWCRSEAAPIVSAIPEHDPPHRPAGAGDAGEQLHQPDLTAGAIVPHALNDLADDPVTVPGERRVCSA